MSGYIVNEVRKGFYLDSVALMRFSRTIADMNGIEEAALMMGTPANREIMINARLLNETGKTAGGGDLIIGIRAEDQISAGRALIEAKSVLDRPTAKKTDGANWQPRTLRAAVKAAPESNLALISVPGDFAIAEARKAIRRGLHAMIFSDNISLAEEAALKQEAKSLGRLVMGPDCGTAIINGTPLAFANKIPRGEIGIVGASGTGIQEVTCLIAQYGGGISQAIGVGGRDLKSQVGGISTLMALDALKIDPQTKHVVLISKPPPADVAALVLERIAAIGKPVTVCFIGADKLPMPKNATQVFTLKAAACAPMGVSNDATTDGDPSIATRSRSKVVGLFCGGTLCAEAQVVFKATGQAVMSNTPIPGVKSLSTSSSAHPMIDLGDDEYTQGKPHPMIDPSVRDQVIIDALGDASVGVILVDVVIGFGAHEDPAGHLASIINVHGGDRPPIIIASVTGTQGDPQTRSIQVAKLKVTGVRVAPSNADAAAWALSAIGLDPMSNAHA